ncbi:ATP-binding protein [Undibacterium oligocarboniphilum]|uniref:ATP-binding protein n=1 Tax=Undibacterium oligocarboniphilum TaxID=666702 RepID=A0A850QIS1_9BURK|nr:ATP-binding protein [Undibacterium oligocarboniphilum]MBC3871405.1 ATP-binding protein [Undibacterium oligocarboniphilum]NVO79019.1 ATP-binding protein [Undibacterium oligocarboniphilum]
MSSQSISTVNTEIAEQIIKRSLKNKRTVLMVGSPGIGKTSITHAVAKAVNYDLVVTTPAIKDPTDAKGLGFPAPDHSHAKFLPLGEMHALLTATRPTLWFLDDLGQANNAVQSSYMPWLLERGSGGQYLPDCVHVIAATNGREHKANVSGILEPVKSRFETIIHVVPEYEIWRRNFAIPKNMPAFILAYLDFCGRTRNPAFNNFIPTADMTNCAIPRTWANAGGWINDYLEECDGSEIELKTTKSPLFHCVSGAIGIGEASNLWNFNSLYYDLPASIDDVIDSPLQVKLPEKIETQLIICNLLCARANADNLQNIYAFAKRVKDKFPGEIIVAMLNDIFVKHPALRQEPTFQAIMTSEEFGMAFTGYAGKATR